MISAPFFTRRSANIRDASTAAFFVFAHRTSPLVALSSRCTGCGRLSARSPSSTFAGGRSAKGTALRRFMRPWPSECVGRPEGFTTTAR